MDLLKIFSWTRHTTHFMLMYRKNWFNCIDLQKNYSPGDIILLRNRAISQEQRTAENMPLRDVTKKLTLHIFKDVLSDIRQVIKEENKKDIKVTLVSITRQVDFRVGT